ncbi:MAG: mechanosensitive ion channel [Candidatus Brocadia sp.]|nr:mechanosensitive ion channel [Candidatus Brocadia sp.]
MKYRMLKRRNAFALVRYLIMCCLWIVLCVNLHAQTIESPAQPSEKEKAVEIALAETGITVKTADVETARIKAEEIKNTLGKSVGEIELSIVNLESDEETTATYLEGLELDKKAYQTGETNPKYLELLDKEIKVVKQKIDGDNEQIRTYNDRITALQNQSKVYAERVVLLESIVRIEDLLATTPSDQASIVRKEADIAKGYLTALQANLKEKETLVSNLVTEVEDVKVRTSTREQDLAKELQLIMADIRDEKLIEKAREKVNSVMLWRKAMSAQWVSIFKSRLETARVWHDEAVQALKNAELNAAFLTEKARRLEEKQKTEELKKKQAELETAKKAEEVTQKVAEMRRAEAEKVFQEAARKGEEVAQKQMVTTSPERKRVLELEAEVHKQIGLVAKKKDELITIGAQRYKDVTEYKKLETKVEYLINEAAALKGVDESLKKVESEIKRFSEAVTALESLIPSVKQEEKLNSDNLAKAYEETSKIEKEVSSFENKELANQAIEYAHQIAKSLEEQGGLISARLDRLYEQLEIKEKALVLLNKTKEELITMKAANVWTRIESNISAQTLRSVYQDLTGCYRQLGNFYGIAQDYGINFVSYISKKHTIDFWIRLCGLLTLVAVFYFYKRFARLWCTNKIQKLYDSGDISYYYTRLLPSLLIVLQKSTNVLWLVILSVSIPYIFDVQNPLITATKFVLTFLAIHRVLTGLLVESFGPEKGDKKLVTSLAYVSPKHLYTSLNIILLFSLITLSVIAVLTVFGYRHDVIELLWFIYRLGMLVLLLWLATQKSFIFKLLPGAESQFGRLIHRLITIIYPVFIVFVVSLFAIRSLGYPVLTYVLLKTCIKSFVIAFIAFWVWKFLHHRLMYVRERQLKRENIKEGAPEEKRFHAVTAVYHISLNYFISIVAAIIIIRVWVGTFRDAIGSPAAPYLVQKIFGQIGIVFGTIGSGLRYRFFFEEGRYTTPIKIIIALAVLIISIFVARYIKKLLEEKVFYKLRLQHGLRQTLSTLIRYVIIGIASLIGLNLAGVPLRSLAFFAGAFGIGIGFGLQNIISNFISGIILLFERPMHVGDVITLEDGTLGTIKKISARSTTLTTPDEITITVPNLKFIESRVTNWTYPSSLMRGFVKVRVAYGSDTALVKKCLLEIARKNPNIKTYPEPFVRFAEFGDSALMFELYYWAEGPGKRWFAMSELNFAIDEIFKKNNIVIAFPQRDIHIRSVAPFPFQDMQGHSKQNENQSA